MLAGMWIMALPTINHQPPTTNHQPPTTNYTDRVVVLWRSDRMHRLARRMILPVLTVALVCITVTAADLPSAAPDTVGMSSARLARIDAMLQAEVAAGRLPGMVVAVARD